MKTEPSAAPDSSQISEARLAANRANAKLATGPKDPESASRFNARKHGLTARLPLPGRDAARKAEFFRWAWPRLGPRNALEESSIANLIETRWLEDVFVNAERDVLTRRPVSLALSVNHAEEFPFLDDTEALNTLEQLTRHLAHLTRVSEKEVLEVLDVRKGGWGERSESLSRPPLVEATNAGAEGAAVPGQQPDPAAPPVNRGTLEDTLADTRLILPGEDVEAYRALARNLWATLRPANALEGFLVADFVQTQWRLDRVRRITQALLERCALSDNGTWCGLGFGFIHDAQNRQALETLRHYEAVLRKRREKRLALLGKVRAEGWADALPSQVKVTATTQPEAASAVSQPSPAHPGLAPAPDQGSPPVPGQSSLMSVVRRKIAEANASGNAT